MILCLYVWGVVVCVVIFVVYFNLKVKVKFFIYKKNILRIDRGILNNLGEILIVIL